MILLDDIHRNFQVGDQTVHALDSVNLNIDSGEYIAITGPSGSGKSTLLNLLGLLDRPTEGTYSLEGTDITSLSDEQQALTRNQKIGFVFQFFHLIPRLSAAENVELPMTLAGVTIDERKQRVNAALQDIGLADRADHRPDQLSGGQRQRVAIARATIMRPSLLLADEPTGNLDTHSGAEVIRILEALNQQQITLMVVTHDRNIASRARRQIHIVDGKIESDTSTASRTSRDAD